jgi:hypothetical protein
MGKTMRRCKVSESLILLWVLAGILLVSIGAGVLAGAGITVGVALILAPRSVEESWATLREGGGRFSAWLSRAFAPRAYGDEEA